MGISHLLFTQQGDTVIKVLQVSMILSLTLMVLIQFTSSNAYWGPIKRGECFTWNEWTARLEKYGSLDSNYFREPFWSVIDTNGDGCVSWLELFIGNGNLSSGRGIIFAKMDTDSNGCLAWEEFSAWANKMYTSENPKLKWYTPKETFDKRDVMTVEGLKWKLGEPDGCISQEEASDF